MSERSPDSGEHGRGVPRDMPDQQAGGAKAPDQWYAEEAQGENEDEEFLEAEEGEELPDTDEAGTGPRGSPQMEEAEPGRPPPAEPTD
ncbi:hypothetical protein [Streptomyces sp. 7N604]|uniref:hypothetical protein n=1 Tax=Streptomyces sp. 7N604 TaxID=3457415 RepID=UPI003FD5D593